MGIGNVHVVFGAGQIGSFLAESLVREGVPVRVVKRRPGGVPDGAEAVFGDAANPGISNLHPAPPSSTFEITSCDSKRLP